MTAIKDSQSYPTGITVTDVELDALNIVRDSFHGEWNYTIKPQDSPVLLNRKLFTEEPLVALAGEVKQVYGSFPEVDACMGWIQILNPDYKGKGYEYPVNNGRFAGTDAAQFSETVDALLRVCVSRVESYT